MSFIFVVEDRTMSVVAQWRRGRVTENIYYRSYQGQLIA